MKLFEECETREETISKGVTYQYIGSIVAIYRNLPRNLPDQHYNLEPLVADMVKEILKYLVHYRGLDANLANEFRHKYLGTLYGFAEERFVLGLGEEKFREMERELLALVNSAK